MEVSRAYLHLRTGPEDDALVISASELLSQLMALAHAAGIPGFQFGTLLLPLCLLCRC